MSPSEVWAVLRPYLDTDDHRIAADAYGSIRSWTWKALDRRRRDDELREWVDLLTRAQAFFSARFVELGAKFEALSELIHESIAVGELGVADDPFRRKHVSRIMHTLEERSSDWLDRAVLMKTLDLKPANVTRLMALVIDMGWVEQSMVGREAKYRLSSGGSAKMRSEIRAAVAPDHTTEQQLISSEEEQVVGELGAVDPEMFSTVIDISKYQHAFLKTRHNKNTKLFQNSYILIADDLSFDDSYYTHTPAIEVGAVSRTVRRVASKSLNDRGGRIAL